MISYDLIRNDVEISPEPVHFTLRAKVEESPFLIALLHGQSLSCGFRHVGDLHYFETDDCIVHNGDRYSHLKIRARGTAFIGKYVVSYIPRSFRGFEAELPNGNIMYIGLSEYDPFIELPDGSVWKTGLSHTTQWQTFVKTFNINQKDPLDCVRSHKVVCELLARAGELKMLSSVFDSTGYWNSLDYLDLPAKNVIIRSF